MGLSYSYEEAADLIDQLMLDTGSHVTASVRGWSYPMSRQEQYALALFARVTNALRDKKEKPFEPDWPWPAEPQAEDVTPEERDTLRAKLRARSAFGQKRTEA